MLGKRKGSIKIDIQSASVLGNSDLTEIKNPAQGGAVII